MTMTKKLLSLVAAAALTGFVGAANAGDLPSALGSVSGQVLDAATMSTITGTDASATLTLGTVQASGLTNATVSATDLGATAATVGGAAPSNTARVTGSLSARSR